MNFTIKNQLIAFSILFSIFFFSSSHAAVFKCIDKKGNTVFQDSGCSNNKKETKIVMQKHTGNSQCTSACETSRATCIAELGMGKRNTNERVFLCEQAKQACTVSCYNPSKGRELEAFTASKRSSYESDIRHKQSLKDEDKYQEEREKRLAQRDKKRKQRHCHKYEKKLDKAKAHWVRVQEQARGWTPRDEAYHRRRIENAEDAVAIECE